MSGEFFDTNVVLYLLDDGPKAETAERLLGRGGIISVQVLNEALVNCRRKAEMSWDETAEFLDAVERLCTVTGLTVETHTLGRALAERYRLAVYDAMIVAAALLAGASVLWTEDMQDGLVVEGMLTLRNPFAA